MEMVVAMMRVKARVPSQNLSDKISAAFTPLFGRTTTPLRL